MTANKPRPRWERHKTYARIRQSGSRHNYENDRSRCISQRSNLHALSRVGELVQCEGSGHDGRSEGCAHPDRCLVLVVSEVPVGVVTDNPDTWSPYHVVSAVAESSPCVFGALRTTEGPGAYDLSRNPPTIWLHSLFKCIYERVIERGVVSREVISMATGQLRGVTS
jgi:hypothetical protein